MSSSSVAPQPAPFRWGILGAGAIAARFARDLAHAPGSAVTAVFARRRDQAHTIADAHGARATDDLDSFFSAPIDAVYIATLPDTHHHFARAALLAGHHVLCEKPVTRSLAELDDLLALATARRLLFMEAMKTPFLPVYRQLRAFLEDRPETAHLAAQLGSFGPVRLVQAGNAAAHTPAGHPSWSAPLAGGALLSIGVYQAFLAVDHLGPALDVQALGHAAGGQTPIPAGAVDSLTLVQARHRHGHAQLYAGLDLASPGTATLCSPGGFAIIHKPWWNSSRVTLTAADGRTAELNIPVVGDGLHYEAAHFADLVRSGQLTDQPWQSPVVPHAHSRAVMHLLDQARAAIGLRFPGEAALDRP